MTKEMEEIIKSHQHWLKNPNHGSRANLHNADLYYADLRNVNLSDADLRNVCLRNANLSYTDLRYADLRNSDLRNADLSYADLRNANLRYTDLRNANLSHIKISWNSHELLAELLWKAAGENVDRQMLSAFVGRKVTWCWDTFLNQFFDHPEKGWALTTLAGWIEEGDEAPAEIKAQANKR